ncbi:MAG: Fic family protein [Chloroflexota bacterium]
MDITFNDAALAPALDAVERRRWLFGNLPIDPLHRDWFRQRAWIRTVHGTTRIEGNTLSDLEVERLLNGSGAKALPRRDALEILGTRSALELADQIGANPAVPIDQAVIRELHRRVLEGQSPLLTPGEYRRGENRVGGADGQIIFATPPSGDVPALMRDFATWLADHESLAPPLLAALTHLEFVAIHPFNDGNGRTARALARLLLVRGGYALDGLVSLDAMLDSQRGDYFAAIRASIGDRYRQPYDATPFAAYFLEAITAAADHVLARMRRLGEVQIEVRRDVVEGRLQPAMLDALAFAFINRSLRAGDYAKMSGRTPASTTRDLAGAVKLKYLVAEGSTRDRWYRLGERLLEAPAPGEPADPRSTPPHPTR